MPVKTPAWKTSFLLDLNFSVRWKWKVEVPAQSYKKVSWISFMIAAEAFRKLCWKTSQSHFKNNWNPSQAPKAFWTSTIKIDLAGILGLGTQIFGTSVRTCALLEFLLMTCEHHTQHTRNKQQATLVNTTFLCVTFAKECHLSRKW